MSQDLEKRKLPTLQELQQDLTVAFKNDQLNLLLNQEPPKQWVKVHPFAKNVLYLPIERVEYLLTKIFQRWRAEIIERGQIFNSVFVHVRLHYMNPTNGEWDFMDGLGAVGIQTDAGASAADMAKIKSDAVMKALPAAESYAIKDAAEKLGKIFGKDLNRKEVVGFEMTYTAPEPASIEKTLQVERLLETSSIGYEEKRDIEIKLELGINVFEADKLIVRLSDNQLNPITHGGNNPSNKEINNMVTAQTR